MTLVMQQVLAMLRSAIKDKDVKDVKLLRSILMRSIEDQPILQMQEEVKEAKRMADEFMETNQ